MGFKLDPFCSRSLEHCQVPFGAGFVEAKNIQTIGASDLDVAVVRSAPLIECFENIDPVPIEKKSPRHSAIREMLLDLNAHDLGPPWSSRGLYRVQTLQRWPITGEPLAIMVTPERNSWCKFRCDVRIGSGQRFLAGACVNAMLARRSCWRACAVRRNGRFVWLASDIA